MFEKKISLNWQGLCSYENSQSLQTQLLEQVLLDQKAVLLGQEYKKPTITLGIRSEAKLDLKKSEVELKKLGYEIAHTRRGGEATVHGPGQLVIYPIIPLKTWGVSIREYVLALQKVTIECLKFYGVDAFLSSGEPGIYTSSGKIAFVGVCVSKAITQHGISINIHNNLEDFALIRSCGKEGESFDSLKATTNDFGQLEDVFKFWSQLFIDAFKH